MFLTMLNKGALKVKLVRGKPPGQMWSMSAGLVSAYSAKVSRPYKSMRTTLECNSSRVSTSFPVGVLLLAVVFLLPQVDLGSKSIKQ